MHGYEKIKKGGKILGEETKKATTKTQKEQSF